MDVRKAVDPIAALVAPQVSLVPTFFIYCRDGAKDWAEFRAEAHVWYKGANLQTGRFDLVVMNPAPVDTFYSRRMWGNVTNPTHLVVNYRY